MLRAYVSPYTDDDEDCGLDQVGRVAVLGAMVEQRKRSSLLPTVADPTATASTIEAASPDETVGDPASTAPTTTEAARPDESGTHPRQRLQSGVDPVDLVDVFQKIR